MRAKELKEYILEDEQRLYKILEDVGFHDIKRLNGELRCALPDGENATAVMVKLNESLYTSLFEMGYNGDLYGALALVMEKDFRSVINYIHALLGLSTKDSGGYEDPLRQLKVFASADPFKDEVTENKLYDISILNQFVDGLHHTVLEQGITPDVAKKYRLMYDPYRDRVIFPHFDWYERDKVVGIKGRTTQSKDEMELLGTPKYWNYITGYHKTLNLYGYNVVADNLHKSKMLILFEGEKSVLKQATYNFGQGCAVALGGHTISEQQIDFILRETPQDCEIVLAFDKDVMVKDEEGLTFIRNQAERFKPFRQASYIFDRYDMLGEKDAPIDKGYELWNYLLKWRMKD